MTEGPLQVVHITDCPLTAADRERVCGVDTGATLAAVLEHIAHPAPPHALIVAHGQFSPDCPPSSFRRLPDPRGATRHPPRASQPVGFPDDERAVTAETDSGVIMAVRHRR